MDITLIAAIVAAAAGLAALVLFAPDIPAILRGPKPRVPSDFTIPFGGVR